MDEQIAQYRRTCFVNNEARMRKNSWFRILLMTVSLVFGAWVIFKFDRALYYSYFGTANFDTHHFLNATRIR